MSYCRSQGKDKIIFVTKDDHEKPAMVEFEPSHDDEEPKGLILSNGEINWNCPCLGGMATGPCGVEFREAFSCFHYSKEEPKGSDCFEAFSTMQDCMSKYPTVYKKFDNDDDDEDTEEIGSMVEAATSKEDNTPPSPMKAETSSASSSTKKEKT
ncbi:unnamed protein product [Darwinula stevensoni]|uniref:CHCH domain-containing protein n=1 Tax=Darwinula stevensoni TaxID=69355 RepID=A0A7R8XMT4_9CRUS|nr:unnamed protein product [Darwinula stevensoni]CAG0895939.1 unnamed protein product [Darwinula stevensoni]